MKSLPHSAVFLFPPLLLLCFIITINIAIAAERADGLLAGTAANSDNNEDDKFEGDQDQEPSSSLGERPQLVLVADSINGGISSSHSRQGGPAAHSPKAEDRIIVISAKSGYL